MRSACAPVVRASSWTALSAGGVVLLGLVAACSGSIVADPGGMGGNGGAGPSSGTYPEVGVGPGTSSVGTGPQTSSVGTGPQTSSVGTGPQTSSVSTGPETTVAVGVGPGSSSSVSTGSQTTGGTGGFGGGATASTAFASAVVATSSSGGGACDTGDCSTCQNCAWFGPCTAAASACDSTPECTAIIQCYQTCAMNDQTCYSKCYWDHVAGHSAYDELFLCLDCDQCYNSCGGQQDGCPPGG